MIEVRRLGPQIGAEIHGVDVRKLDDAGFAVIYRAWLDSTVLVVPGQQLEIQDFLRYSRRFGVVHPHPSLALVITTLAFHILGDSVRDALDPRGGGVYV